MAKKQSGNSPTGRDDLIDANTSVPISLVPPQSIEAEMSILGSMILEAKNIPTIVARIGGVGQGSKFFYKTAHTIIYDAIAKLYASGDTVDLITLSDALGERLERVGGTAYLATLMDSAQGQDPESHLKIIIKKRKERVRIKTAQKIITTWGKLNEVGEQECDFLTETDETIRNDIFGDEEVKTRNIAQICKDVLNEWSARIDTGGILGKSSHLPRLDAMLGGWVGGRLYVLGARPAVGKTSIGLQFCDYVVRGASERVCFVSLEMQDSDLIGRVVCQRARINYGQIQTDPKQFSADADWERITNTFSELRDSKWVINDRSGLDVYQICSIIENAHNQSPLGLACVDYLQLFAGISEEFLVIAIANACRIIRDCAKRLGIPIILISQLSRAVETRRGDKRPLPSDLRDSGGIEQVADAIIFIYRDVLYNRNITTQRARSVAEVIVAKNRHGPTGTVYCFFDSRTTRFFVDDYEFAFLVKDGEYPSVDENYLRRHRFTNEAGEVIVPHSGLLRRDIVLDDDDDDSPKKPESPKEGKEGKKPKKPKPPAPAEEDFVPDPTDAPFG